MLDPRSVWPTLLLLAVLLPTLALAAPPSAPQRHLLLVSIDGLAWPTLQRALPRLPTLSRLAREGTSAPLTSVFPSLTWPAHTSLVTGVFPAKHGVLGNRVYDRATKKVTELVEMPAIIRGPTLFSVAHAKGLKTAALLWPATSGAPGLDWNLPEVHEQAEFQRYASPGLLKELQAAGLPVAQLGRIGREELFLSDSFVRDAAVHLIRRHKPALLLVHFLSVDSVAHQFGPGSRAVDWALELVDRYLGDVLAALHAAGIAGQTDVLVVSDHGFLAIDKYADPLEILKLAGVKPAGLGLAINGQALFVSTPTATDAIAVADKLRAAKLPEIASVLEGLALTELGLPTPVQDPRAPDLVVVAPPNVFWVAGRGRRYKGPLNTLGMHGHPPGPPELQGIFVAAGPRLIQGGPMLTGLRLVDVAVLAGQLLQAPLPGAVDGVVPKGLIR